MKTDRSFRSLLILTALLSLLLVSAAAGAGSEAEYYKPIREISLGVKELTMNIGEQFTLPLTHVPEETPNVFLKWYMDETTIQVDPETLTVTALAPGKTRLLVESNAGFAFDYCDVTVTGSEPKDAPVKKSGSEMVTLSKADRIKIKAETILHYLEFIESSSFTPEKTAELLSREFNVTADVRPGTVEAESRRALALGMEDVMEFPDLDAVGLYGTLAQILAFVENNDDLIRIFEFAPIDIDDPVFYDDAPEAKTMNLKSNVESVTTVSRAHELGLTGTGTVIAVIDTGLNKDHEQFAGRVIEEACLPASSSAYTPVCVSGSSLPSEATLPAKNNHGSHVTGIAAGRNGIAPEAKIISINISVEECSDGVCTQTLYWNSYYIAEYLVDLQNSYKENGSPQIVAVNMSLGSQKYASICDEEQSGYKRAFDLLVDNGMIPVVSAGNEGYDGYIGRPACVSSAFRVGALFDTETLQIAPYSNHNELIDIVAPGTRIWSAFYIWESNTSAVCEDGEGGRTNCYGKYSGTSMAAPMVTGAFALLKQANPDMTVAQLESKLKSMSSKIVNYRLPGSYWRNGRIDDNPEVHFAYDKPVLDFSQITYIPPASAVKIYDPGSNEISGQTITIHTADYLLTAAAEPGGAQQNFTWSVDDEEIAAVNNGAVSFKKAGTVTVTAAAADGSGKSAWVKITYIPLASAVKIYSPDNTEISGQTVTINTNNYQLRAEAEPDGALQNFTWTVSDPQTASVDENGLVSFRKPGPVTVTAAASDGSGKSADAELIFAPQNVCGVNVEYTVEAGTISFTKADPDSDAAWGSDCRAVIIEDAEITKVNITEPIRAADSSEADGGMFTGCINVQKMVLTGLDVSGITNMDSMFENCFSLTDPGMSGWNTGSVTSMKSMFRGCGSLTGLDASGLDTSNVTDMKWMFTGCESLADLNVSGWKTSNVTDMSSMFEDCYRLAGLDVSGWNVSEVTNMSYMFKNCHELAGLDVSGWKPAKVTKMNAMFYACGALTGLDVSGWDTSSVTTVQQMFFDCGSLQNLDVSGWKTPNVTNMGEMFSGCRSLAAPDVSGWKTSKVTNMESMFVGCSSVTSLDVSGWDTSAVTVMESIFDGCSSLAALDVSRWNIAGVQNMDYMFSGCGSLTELDLSGWDTSDPANRNDMFNGCGALHTLTLGRNTVSENIFESLPAYKDTWYYVVQGADAGDPLELKTARKNGTLFTAYTSNTMAGTWTTDLLAAAVKIQNASGKDITGKTVTIKSMTVQLKAIAEPSWASQKFTWTSSDTAAAAVDANGKVTFKKAGMVTITAKTTDGSNLSAWVKVKCVLATAVKIYDPKGNDITGKTVKINTAAYQLKAAAEPAEAAQKFTWKSSDGIIASVDANGKVTFKQGGTVTITATAADGSKKSASVKLTFNQCVSLNLEIKDSNVRGKNSEIQVVIPWNPGWTKVECKLYDDETNKLVSPVPTFRERMDSTGKNKVISYVGSPLQNGHVYRMEIRVNNGCQWSSTVKKYGMPIVNVYGATVVAGNRTMIINTKHREPSDGTRYMIYDPATGKEIAYKAGTRTNTTWTYSELTNGKLYYVVAVPYRDYKGQRLWGPNENKIYFLPMSIPGNGTVSFSGTNAKVTIGKDGTVDGIRVLYRTVDGKIMNGCEGAGNSCTIKGLNSGTAYEFYPMKYKTVDGRKYYSTGTLILHKTAGSGLKAPQMNPTVAMSNSGSTTFTIKKAAEAEGISVLYREGEGAFRQACEKAGNSCNTTLDVKANYTFYIMQYRTVNGKKMYSPGIVARDFSSGKTGTAGKSADLPAEIPTPSAEEVQPETLELYRLEDPENPKSVPSFGK